MSFKDLMKTMPYDKMENMVNFKFLYNNLDITMKTQVKMLFGVDVNILHSAKYADENGYGIPSAIYYVKTDKPLTYFHPDRNKYRELKNRILDKFDIIDTFKSKTYRSGIEITIGWGKVAADLQDTIDIIDEHSDIFKDM